MNNPAAWHPDPTGTHEYRWWDGARWTEHVADNGQASVDPLPQTPTPAADTGAEVPHDPAGSAPRESDTAGRADDQATSGAGTDPWRTSSGDGDTGASATWQMPGAERATPRPTTQDWQSSGAGPGWSSGGAAAAPAPSSAMAIAAAVIGVLSLLISFVPLVGLIGGLGGVLALVLGFIAKKRASVHGVGRGAAITGIVTGILALLISVVFTAGFVIIGGDVVSTYGDCIDAGGTDAECQQELNRGIMEQFGG